jgi:ribosomal protein S18 acetylase RimI-like enzyme
VAGQVAPFELRAATEDDADAIAAIWAAGWRDGHVGNVPEELVAARTDESFRARARGLVPGTTVATVDGAIAGFVTVVGDELDQVYVAEGHRGSGVADALLSDAERRVAAAGYPEAWLVVVPGNDRALAFYERNGWTDGGLFDHPAPTDGEPVPVRSHRYTKRISVPDA